MARHGPTVWRVCRAVVGPVDADDAWSETFIAALRAWPDLPADANVEAWLVTIAHRKAIDSVRRAARTPVPVAAPVLAAGVAPGRPDDRAPLGDRDLTELLATLTERQRYAVAYHHLAGLPYAEVAAIIGGSAESVRRAASDGIARLRHQLGPLDREEHLD